MFQKRNVIVMLFGVLIIALIVVSVRLSQANERLENKESLMDIYFERVVSFDRIQQGFELVRKHEDEFSYRNLYALLYDVEASIRAMADYNRDEIEGLIGDQMYDIDGEVITGAAPTVLLSTNNQPISLSKLNELEQIWSEFFVTTRSALAQHEEVPTDIVVQYKKLALDVMKWSEEFE